MLIFFSNRNTNSAVVLTMYYHHSTALATSDHSHAGGTAIPIIQATLNYKKRAPECTKTHRFETKNGKFYRSGEGCPLPHGEGDCGAHTANGLAQIAA